VIANVVTGIRFPKSAVFAAPMSLIEAFQVSTAMNAPGSARYASCGPTSRSSWVEGIGTRPETAPASVAPASVNQPRLAVSAV